MPTAYTAELDENDMPTAQWLKERLVRNFGIAVTFRENGHMTEEQLEKALADNLANNYSEKKVTELAARKLELLAFSSDQIQEIIDEKNAEIEKYNEEKKAECERRRAIFDRARADLEKVLKGSEDEVTCNVAQFGLDQLDLVMGRGACRGGDETEPHVQDLIELSPNEWVIEEIARVEKDIEYHMKERDKEWEREGERHQYYLKFVDEVDRILGVE